MPSSSFFPSSESQQRWREHMTYNYIKNPDIHPCVFRVPDILRDSKPEAYIPQVLGLGPYHHFRPEVQLMSSKKRAAVQDYLGVVDFEYFVRLINKSPEEFEPITRSCYDRYLDLDKETLQWIVIVDSIVLLHFIDTCLGPDAEKRIYYDVEKLVPDVLMLENQIPIILILEMHKVIDSTFIATDSELYGKFYRFCSQHSPFEVTNIEERRQEAFDKNSHVLHFMYQMIMKNKGPNNDQHDFESLSDEGTSDGENGGTSKNRVGVLAQVAQVTADCVGEFWDHAVGEFNSALEKARKAGVKAPGNIQKVYQLLQKAQSTFLLQHNKEVFPGEKIEIPSVSRLVAILNIKFEPLPSGCGIGDIALKATDGRNYKFYLPVIHMQASSEVIFRNLVVYEATISKQEQGSTPFRDYVDLICGLIKSEKDVQLLKNANIIKGKLADEQIVEICNGFQKSDEKPHDKSKVHNTVKDANDQFNNSRYVKCWRGFMKFVVFMVQMFRLMEFLAFMVNIFSTLFPVFIFIFLFIQSSCQIYDCRARPNGGAAMQNLYFGSSLESDPPAKFMLPRKLLPY